MNLETFGDLAEEIVKKLFVLAQKVELEVVLPGGSDELLDRYTFVLSR